MAQLSLAFCRQLAQARREKQLTQGALALAVGCKQPAISMLEAGQTTKVSMETVAKIAELLDVPMPVGDTATLRDALEPSIVPAPSLAFCPQLLCFSNVPYVVGGRLLLWPNRAFAATATHCAICGELLERHCPHCGKKLIGVGGCCGSCGGALVTNTLSDETDLEEWVARRCREIDAWQQNISQT